MPPPAMTRFPVPELEDLPEDIREHLLAETERTGFTPNYFIAMAYKPGQYRAFFDFYETLIHESSLEREEIEMLTVTVSGTNNCPYCVVAHGALLRIYGDDPYLAEQLMMNHRTADIGEAHKVMCDLAVKLTRRPAEITDYDIGKLQEYGFSKEEIWDIGAVTALFNLSNRMVHLANIRPNEEFYELGRTIRRELVEDLRDPYLAVDGDYCLMDFNLASAQLFEDVDEEVLGDPIEDICSELINQVDEFKSTESIDTVVSLNRDGTRRFYDVSIEPRTRGPPHLHQSRMIVLRDITLLKQREAELEQKNNRLDAFANVVSHDLRNPLNVAQGYLDIVRDDIDREELARIEKSHERMETLIEQLLTYARFGEEAIETEPVSVAETTGDAWETAVTAQAKLDLVTDERQIHADKDRFQQLFENLFRNAIEHGSETVTVRVGLLESGFYVEDDGPGIPEEERDAIFQTGHTTREGGTGFGLAIVKQIVDSHDWNIRVTESDAGGARFEITNVTIAD